MDPVSNKHKTGTPPTEIWVSFDSPTILVKVSISGHCFPWPAVCPLTEATTLLAPASHSAWA